MTSVVEELKKIADLCGRTRLRVSTRTRLAAKLHEARAPDHGGA